MMKQRLEFAILLTVTGFLLYGLSGTTNTLLLVLSCLVPLIGLGAFFLPTILSREGKTASTIKTEQAYLIRTNKRIEVKGFQFQIGNEYPMTVNAETLEKALATGDYDYEGPATGNEAGDHFVNDGSGGTGSYVPPGHIAVVNGVEYLDERLN